MCISYSFVYLHLTTDLRPKALSWAFPINLPSPGGRTGPAEDYFTGAETELHKVEGPRPRFCGK